MCQNDHMDTHLRTCEKIAQANGVSPKFVRRAEKYANGIDAAEAAVPGAMEEILTGHIKATDAEITALAQTPKEEIPAIIKELRKPKKDRKAKKLTSPEKSDGAADDAADSNEVHTESEITPVSNSPPDSKGESKVTNAVLPTKIENDFGNPLTTAIIKRPLRTAQL